MNVYNAQKAVATPAANLMLQSASSYTSISNYNNCHTATSTGCDNCLTIPDDLLAQEQFALQVATDELNYFQFENGARYGDEASVYGSLDEHPEWRMENYTLFQFYDSLQYQPVGQFAELQHMINQAFEDVTDSIVPIGILQQAIDFNTTIDAQHICEQNWKAYYSVMLTMLNEQRTDFIEDEEDVLLNVAGQCVHEGCEAVLLSRALLMTKYDYVWDDSLLCDSSYAYRIAPPIKHVKKHTQIRTTETDGIKIMPNPAKEEFTIQLEEISNNATIEIYNAVGQLVTARKVDNTTLLQKFNVGEWVGGMYYCKVKLTNGKVITKMITIIR
jgi:hypothetical protein